MCSTNPYSKSIKIKYLSGKRPNPIIGYHRGEPYRVYNKIQIRVNVFEFKKFIDLKKDKGMSARDALEQYGILCRPCSSISIISFNQEDAKSNTGG